MIYAVLLAAGNSSRLHLKTKKQFIKINDKPVFQYSIDKFLKIKNIDTIILVINKLDIHNKCIKLFIKNYNKFIKNNKINIVIGGINRYDSVRNSLDFIYSYFNVSKYDKVLIHDVARPNVSIEDIKDLIKYSNKYSSITLGSSINDTIKEIHSSENNNVLKIKKTLNRNDYCLICTPQMFNLELLYKCYNLFYKCKKKLKITDDLQIIELFSKVKTYVLISSKNNLKITTQNDLNMIKYML